MPNNYRVYRLDRTNHVLEVDWLDAASDEEAVAAARAMTRPGKCEIWHGEHLIATFEVPSARQHSGAFWL